MRTFGWSSTVLTPAMRICDCGTGRPPLAWICWRRTAKEAFGGGGAVLATTARDSIAAGGRKRACAPAPITLRCWGVKPGVVAATVVTARESTFTKLRETGRAEVNVSPETAVTYVRLT